MMMGFYRDFYFNVNEDPPRKSSVHRYEHEPMRSSPNASDLPAIVSLLIFIFLVALVLSQLLISNSTRSNSNVLESKNIRQELRQMDETIQNVLKKEALTIEQWQPLHRFQSHWDRFETLFSSTKNSSREISFKMSQSYCDEVPPDLQGRFLDENITFVNLSMREMELNFPQVELGGHWSPSHCLARHRVAIIIPYRDRFEHLITLLFYLHQVLQRQQLDYQIFVTEQLGNGTYNKAILMNAAFLYASNHYPFQCFVFHDVDLIPEDDRNMYSCPEYPRHMSVAVDELHYQLLYEELIGGVFNIRREHFLQVNGYSNLYWGWGAEDDDLYYRIKKVSLKLSRPPSVIARYKMLRHTKRKPAKWAKRAKLLRTAANRYRWDGLSSLRYNMTSVTTYPLFTHFYIDVGTPPAGFN